MHACCIVIGVREYFTYLFVSFEVVKYNASFVAVEVTVHIGFILVGRFIIETYDTEAVVPVHLFHKFKFVCAGVLVVKLGFYTVSQLCVGSQISIFIKFVALNRISSIFVFEQLRDFAGGSIQAIRFKYLFVVFIHLKNNNILLIFQNADNAGSYPFERRQVAGVSAIDICCINVEIFVSALVHHIVKFFIAYPSIAFYQFIFFFDGTVDFAGGNFFHIYVIFVFVILFEIRHVFPIGRQAERRCFRARKIVGYLIFVVASIKCSQLFKCFVGSNQCRVAGQFAFEFPECQRQFCAHLFKISCNAIAGQFTRKHNFSCGNAHT